jgi:hypothetical protein
VRATGVAGVIGSGSIEHSFTDPLHQSVIPDIECIAYDDVAHIVIGWISVTTYIRVFYVEVQNMERVRAEKAGRDLYGIIRGFRWK